MELVINYGLYLIAGVCIMVPFFGFGLGPPVVIKTALAVFFGNSYSQIAEQGLLRKLIDENKGGNSKLGPLLPGLEKAQETIDKIENPALRMKAEAHHEGHHIIPIPVYVGVFLVLLVGTVITVYAAQFDFGSMNTVIAMLIATIKASFVLGFFMHLKYDNMMNRVIFGSAFFFLMLLIAFSAADIFTRHPVIKSF
ncbi:MAG: cytochrome C oxidase subunit IV family protein [Leptospiraceae bacterium]|nr:cytochrome C oxidase subunit IV family protein [Leptospiraceae bacterium]MCP5513290.1 cytochrome C oxidase subunit IV family protein [Leptospiraceae bacterium]